MVKWNEKLPCDAVIAFEQEDYFVWDCSVIKGPDGKYHMFSSHWPKHMGFGWNWLFQSQIIHSVSEKPEGPYTFANVVFERRGPQYFDGMNTHNTCIRQYGGKYYLYYMGCTYEGNPPAHASEVNYERAVQVWNKKRIGVAVADDLNGTFIRRSEPILEPRSEEHWDCTATTNPAVCILKDGTTFMIYKSRKCAGGTLRLGVAKADKPDGPFTRLQENPILTFDDPDMHVEDPFLWYDENRKVFCLVAKDDSKNGSYGITGEWGNGFYAESTDCIHFTVAENPLVYRRSVCWKDGHESTQNNLERPCILLGENGRPEYLFCASGDGSHPYVFDKTYILCMKFGKEKYGT